MLRYSFRLLKFSKYKATPRSSDRVNQVTPVFIPSLRVSMGGCGQWEAVCSYPLCKHEGVAVAVGFVGISCLHKHEVVIVVIDVTGRCYLVELDTMKNSLHGPQIEAVINPLVLGSRFL